MALMTVLEMTQSVLASMGSDNVNDISDTDEADEVSQIVEDVYFEIIANGEWPHLKELVQLDNIGDNAKPTYVVIASAIQYLCEDTMYYNVKETGDANDNYASILWHTPEQFLARMYPRSVRSGDSDITKITDATGAKLYVLNDTRPTYYTTFDDINLVFDAYDAGIDTTLSAGKTTVMGYKEPVFTRSNSFTPDLPSSRVQKHCCYTDSTGSEPEGRAESAEIKS